MRYWVLPLFICFVALQVQGATWQVERDGSGDFTIIQDCVDASASGDTILIGSGRYNDWQMYGGSVQYPARVIIVDKDLTIIGESDGSTVIGPEIPWQVGTPRHHGIVLFSNSIVKIQNLTIVNLFGGAMSWLGGWFSIAGCSFLDTNLAVYFEGGGGRVSDCDFSSSVQISDQIFSNFQDTIEIKNCEIRQTDNFLSLTHGIDVAGCPDARIENCHIFGVAVGVQINFGTDAVVSNSRIEGVSRVAVTMGLGGRSLNMKDCTISNSRIAFKSGEVGSILMVESTTLEDIEVASLVCNNLQEGFFRGCILAKGDRGVVLYQPHLREEGKGASVVNDFDMRDNFWSTDSPDSIQAWIEDNTDDQVINYRILWEPFNGGAVPSKSFTLGSFKSLFR